MKEPSETPETFSESNGWRLIKKLIVLLVFLAAAFGGTWFLYGADVLTAFLDLRSGCRRYFGGHYYFKSFYP